MSWSKEEEDHWKWMWENLPEFIELKKYVERYLEELMRQYDPLAPDKREKET